MKEKTFIHNILFRIFYPPVAGLCTYLVVLMVFDSLDQLSDNFFSREAFLLILLAYLQAESFVLMIGILDRRLPFEKHYTLRILTQFGMAFLTGTVIVSSGLLIYFRLSFGSLDFVPELVAINSVFLLNTVLYHLYHVSIYHLIRHRSLLFGKEEEFRKNLETERDQVMEEINPELLFRCLESMISMTRTDPRQADDYIRKLAMQYRYLLDGRKKELNGLGEELSCAGNLVGLLNPMVGGSIRLEIAGECAGVTGQLVAGTLVVLVEYAVMHSIVNPMQDLILEISAGQKNEVYFRYAENDNLSANGDGVRGWDRIRNSYAYYAGEPLELERKDGYCFVEIPLLQVLEEDEQLSPKHEHTDH